MFKARAKNGGFDFGSEHATHMFTKDLKENEGRLYEISRLLPESRKQRGFYEGAVLKLWCYFDGHDYTSSKILRQYHENANREFNGEDVVISGKSRRVGKSSKGKLNGESGMIEKVIAYLEENYAIKRQEVLDPEHYKDFRDRIYASGKYDTFIDYLKELKRL
jgi:hypothetical protein